EEVGVICSSAPCGRGRGEGAARGSATTIAYCNAATEGFIRAYRRETPPPTPAHKGRGNVWLEGDREFQQQISGKETMAIQAPSAEHVKEIAASFGIALSEADAASFAGLLKGVAASY